MIKSKAIEFIIFIFIDTITYLHNQKKKKNAFFLCNFACLTENLNESNTVQLSRMRGANEIYTHTQTPHPHTQNNENQNNFSL